MFSDFGDAGGNLDLEWDKVRVSLPIKVATDAQAAANIKAMEAGAWRPFTSAALRWGRECSTDGLPSG